MHKRILALALCFVLLFGLFSFARADSTVSVSFSSADVASLAGLRTMLTLRLSEASDTMLYVWLKRLDNDCHLGIPVPAGETEATLSVPSPKDTASAPITYEILPRDAYRIGEAPSCTLTPVAPPVFTLGDGKNLICGTPGQEMTLAIHSPKHPLFREPLQLTLVSESGQELATLSYPCGARNRKLRFVFPDDTGEMTALSLYAYELSDSPLAVFDAAAIKCTYKGISSVARDDGLVGISFDCAYSEMHTYAIVDILEEYGATATFFMVGPWAGNHGPWIERIMAGGNEPGNHSMTHERMAKMSPSKIQKELLEAEDLILKAAGVRSRYFRPPYGNGSAQLTTICHIMGYEVIGWSIDSRDWDEDLSAYQIANRVCSNVKSGDIILFHNAARLVEQYLPMVLQHLADNGMRGVRISDMVYQDDYYVDEDGCQHRNPPPAEQP